MSRNTYAEVNLLNLKNNILFLRKKLQPETKYMAVVKANAYGHGIIEVSKYIEKEQLVDYLAVAISDEAVLLRKNDVHLPILILGLSNEESFDEIIKFNNIMPAITSLDEIEKLNELSIKHSKTVKIHLKIDTGMNRIGFKDIDEFKKALNYINTHSNIILDGIFTHFAMSDDPISEYTEEQHKRFQIYLNELKAYDLHPIIHCANSGAILNFPHLQYDMVRGGISMYGYNPNPNSEKCGLKPVLSWKTNIVYMKKIPCGETISYGRTYTADKEITVATLPVGYGDGFSRKVSNTGFVLVNGHKCRVLGTVCMDQIMCDVTDAEAKIGDEVVIIGNQQGEEITADLFAKWSETISYEVLLNISGRVPRNYFC